MLGLKSMRVWIERVSKKYLVKGEGKEVEYRKRKRNIKKKRKKYYKGG